MPGSWRCWTLDWSPRFPWQTGAHVAACSVLVGTAQFSSARCDPQHRPHPGTLLAAATARTNLVCAVRYPECQLRREAMISAIIHLGNRDWASLIDDFVSLRFLPPDCNRGQIIPVRRSMLVALAMATSPASTRASRRRLCDHDTGRCRLTSWFRARQVMETVLSPYLRGGGARSINFQARHSCSREGVLARCWAAPVCNTVRLLAGVNLETAIAAIKAGCVPAALLLSFSACQPCVCRSCHRT